MEYNQNHDFVQLCIDTRRVLLRLLQTVWKIKWTKSEELK